MTTEPDPTMTDRERMQEYLDLSASKDFFAFYRQVMDKVGLVTHIAMVPAFKSELLDLETTDPARWKTALRVARIKMYDPVLYKSMKPTYRQHERSFVENWEVYPARKKEGLPTRSAPLYILQDVWKLAKNTKMAEVPHPYEFDQFLRERPWFAVKAREGRDDKYTYELSERGLRKRARIDFGKRCRRMLRASWQGIKATARWVGKCTRHPVIAGTLLLVIGGFLTLVIQILLKRFGVDLDALLML